MESRRRVNWHSSLFGVWKCRQKIRERSQRKATTITGVYIPTSRTFLSHLINYRETAGDSVDPNESLAAGSSDNITHAHKPTAFATAGLVDEIPDDDDGGGGGLMVRMFSSLVHLLLLQSS